ncbi:MAG TPA: hypothetical protein VH092_05080 [Urbifossiella sp.]|jgi:hypothetical protein|nr:hypothetical protein [Urbifossiella sp.]
MNKLIPLFVVLVWSGGDARAGLILATSNPTGSPLVMTAGTTSGPMYLRVASDDPATDVVSNWGVQLEIAPISGGGPGSALTFSSSLSGAVSNPIDYLFPSNGFGIFAANGGTVLDANDFSYDFATGLSPAVSVGSSNNNLLQLQFDAAATASGTYGIYARQGAALTEWSDDGTATRFFNNVPDGDGLVLLGVVVVNGLGGGDGGGVSPVPVPPTALLFGIGFAAIIRSGRRHSTIHPIR